MKRQSSQLLAERKGKETGGRSSKKNDLKQQRSRVVGATDSAERDTIRRIDYL